MPGYFGCCDKEWAGGGGWMNLLETPLGVILRDSGRLRLMDLQKTLDGTKRIWSGTDADD